MYGMESLLVAQVVDLSVIMIMCRLLVLVYRVDCLMCSKNFLHLFY